MKKKNEEDNTFSLFLLEMDIIRSNLLKNWVFFLLGG